MPESLRPIKQHKVHLYIVPTIVTDNTGLMCRTAEKEEENRSSRSEG